MRFPILVKFKRTMNISFFSYNVGIRNETFHFEQKINVIKLSLHNEIIVNFKTHPTLFTLIIAEE